MKLVTEYLEQAVQFERLAASETDPKLKAELEKQAAVYHKLAAKRAEEMGNTDAPQTGVAKPDRRPVHF